MFVDPRVAHGRARFDLSRSPRMVAEERRAEIADLVAHCLERFAGERTRRNLMRLLSRQVAPKLARLGLEPYVGELGQAQGLFVNFSTMSAEHGLREFQLQVTVPELLLKSFASTVVRPHAVARCMQRNGTTSLAQIEQETNIAFVLARTMRALALVEGWKQIGVPGNEGLFIGEMTASDDVCLKTYIKPQANGRSSRWDGFLALFDAMPKWQADQVRQGSELLQWMVDHIVALRKSAALSDRFPFLLEPYRSIDDPLDAAWKAAPDRGNAS